jgi:hypothetical protein
VGGPPLVGWGRLVQKCRFSLVSPQLGASRCRPAARGGPLTPFTISGAREGDSHADDFRFSVRDRGFGPLGIAFQFGRYNASALGM